MRKIAVIIMSLFPTGRVFAGTPDQYTRGWGSCLDSQSGGDVATLQCLEPLFRNIVVSILTLSGVAMFVMLVVGGFTFLLSAGDPKKLESAKHTIQYAIIGMILIVASYLILRLIEVFTGVKVTDFVVPGPSDGTSGAGGPMQPTQF